MIKMYEKVRVIVRANLPGPTTYLYPIYKYYFPLLSNKMKEMAQNIFAQYNLPDLPVSKIIFLITKQSDFPNSSIVNFAIPTFISNNFFIATQSTT